MALALRFCQFQARVDGYIRDVRGGIDLIQKAATILSVENAGEAPGSVLEWLDIHYLNKEEVAWLRALNLEWPGKIVHPGQVDISDVVCRVVVANLPASPSFSQLVS